MPDVRPEIREFFDRYEHATHLYEHASPNPDAAGLLLECFCETFFSLDPNRAVPVPREALLGALPARSQLFASIGAEGLDLVELNEQPLDAVHTIAFTTWRVRFAPDAPDDTPLELASDFLLRYQAGRWRIAVYLNHTDLPEQFATRAAAAGSR